MKSIFSYCYIVILSPSPERGVYREMNKQLCTETAAYICTNHSSRKHRQSEIVAPRRADGCSGCCIIENFFVPLRSKPKTNAMTRFEHFLTLIVFPVCFVIQWVMIDEVVSNHPISGDKVISNYPIVGRGDYSINTPIVRDDLSSIKPISSG